MNARAIVDERKVEDLRSFKALKMHNLRIEYALKALEGCKNFLEIGSGEGFCTRSIVHWAKQPFDDVQGFDIDPKRVSLASQSWVNEGKISYQVADAEKPFPYKDRQFDAVIILDLLEHVGQPHRVIEEARRVLKSGGIFFLVVPCEGEHRTLHRWLRSKGWEGSLKYVGHVQAFKQSDVLDLLNAHGFKVQWVRYSAHPIGQYTDYLGYEIKKYHALDQKNTLKGFSRLKFYLMKKAIKSFLQKISYIESVLFSRVAWRAMDLNICCLGSPGVESR